MAGYFYGNLLTYNDYFRPWMPVQGTNLPYGSHDQTQFILQPSCPVFFKSEDLLAGYWNEDQLSPMLSDRLKTQRNNSEFYSSSNRAAAVKARKSHFTAQNNRTGGPEPPRKYPLVHSPPPVYQISKAGAKKSFCSFCRQNGDRKEFYTDHSLKDSAGKVLCPVLRVHTCEICGATGDVAHTISYCPILKEKGIKQKNSVCLKKRPFDSCGRMRLFYPELQNHMCVICGAAGEESHAIQHCPLLNTSGMKTKTCSQFQKDIIQ